MANQTISLWGATYSGVPAVTLPKSPSGTATFTDVTDTTATAADVAAGKYFYLADGTKTEGTGSGGGGYVTQDANGYIVLPSTGGGSITVSPLSVTSNGTYTAQAGEAYSPVTVNVSGGGGSSYSAVSVGSLEVAASTTSTSDINISTLTCSTASFSPSKFVYIKVRDKAGKRNGYFYGVDLFFIWRNSDGTTYFNPAKNIYRCDSSGKILSYAAGTSTYYGVYVKNIDNTGSILVRARYSSSYSLTIDGTYSIDIYTLEWPNNVSPFD